MPAFLHFCISNLFRISDFEFRVSEQLRGGNNGMPLTSVKLN
jgi:hypothetical protein